MLTKEIGMNEATFYNCAKRGSIDTNRLEEIAAHLNVNPSIFFSESEHNLPMENTDCEKEISKRDLKIKELQQRVKALEFAFETMKLSLQQVDNKFAEDIMKTIEKYLEE